MINRSKKEVMKVIGVQTQVHEPPSRQWPSRNKNGENLRLFRCKNKQKSDKKSDKKVRIMKNQLIIILLVSKI